jgi:hypothetical protein
VLTIGAACPIYDVYEAGQHAPTGDKTATQPTTVMAITQKASAMLSTLLKLKQSAKLKAKLKRLIAA